MVIVHLIINFPWYSKHDFHSKHIISFNICCLIYANLGKNTL